MKSFFKVKTVQEVWKLIAGFKPLGAEEAPLDRAFGRVLAEPVAAAENIPPFHRSAMDGYAVRARDTFGATEGLPGLFTVTGEISMGCEPDFEIGPNQAARIWTGGMLPAGADAVVMIEYARPVDETTVELARAVAPYEQVIRPGEDVRKGDIILKQGLRLRPQDVGLLAAMGIPRLSVRRIPRAAIISTGDEIVPVEAEPGSGQVRDINTYTMGALVRKAYGEPVCLGLVPDNLDRIKKTVAEGLARADMVILSGGSSVGVRDFTIEAFSQFPDAEILVHGVSVSPGKPTILARLGNQALWGLPGHAVSAMITFDLFVKPMLARLSGEQDGDGCFGKSVTAVLSRNVASVHGREDFVRVRLETGPDGLISAYPILGKSALISTMVKADGLLRVGLNVEGISKGTEVEIQLF